MILSLSVGWAMVKAAFFFFSVVKPK